MEQAEAGNGQHVDKKTADRQTSKTDRRALSLQPLPCLRPERVDTETASSTWWGSEGRSLGRRAGTLLCCLQALAPREPARTWVEGLWSRGLWGGASGAGVLSDTPPCWGFLVLEPGQTGWGPPTAHPPLPPGALSPQHPPLLSGRSRCQAWPQAKAHGDPNLHPVKAPACRTLPARRPDPLRLRRG